MKTTTREIYINWCKELVKIIDEGGFYKELPRFNLVSVHYYNNLQVQKIQVNWKCCGSVNLEEAKEFAQEIDNAVLFAEVFQDRIMSKYPKEVLKKLSLC